MITNKDIRVENGNLVLNGDKYPLDGQSPEAIMSIVEDNSDTTPTESSTAPITSGGVFTALSGKEDTLTFDTTPTAESANPVTSAGIKNYVDTAVGKITYTDLTINPSSSGYASPIQTNGGVYYEALASYAELGITKDKILSISLVDFTSQTKQFMFYLASPGIGALSDSNTSVYLLQNPDADLKIRIAHI